MEEKSEVPGEKHIPLPLKLMAGWWVSPSISDSSSIKTDGWLVFFSWYF
jgi:hypothetical protein